MLWPPGVKFLYELSVVLDRWAELASAEENDESRVVISEVSSREIHSLYEKARPMLPDSMLKSFNDAEWKSYLADWSEKIIVNLAFLSQTMGITAYLGHNFNIWLDMNLKWSYIYYLNLKIPHLPDNDPVDEWHLMNLIVPVGSIPSIFCNAEKDGVVSFLEREQVLFYYRQNVTSTILDYEETKFKFSIDNHFEISALRIWLDTSKINLGSKIKLRIYTVDSNSIHTKYVGKLNDVVSIVASMKAPVLLFSEQMIKRDLNSFISYVFKDQKFKVLTLKDSFQSRSSHYLFFLIVLNSFFEGSSVIDTRRIGELSVNISNFNQIKIEDMTRIRSHVEKSLKSLNKGFRIQTVQRASIQDDTYPSVQVAFPFNIIKIE